MENVEMLVTEINQQFLKEKKEELDKILTTEEKEDFKDFIQDFAGELESEQ